MWSKRQAIEIFHLTFVAQLGRRVDKALFAIKGGCNLRFFYHSIRYSEDIDFDIRTTAKETLAKNVNTILGSPGFNQALRVNGIGIEHVSSAKQTAATQRWKVGLQIADGIRIPTKIEFSRRHGLDDGYELEPVDTELIRAYKLMPVLSQHYSIEAAFRQKIGALTYRTVTQARDIFDLKLLIDAGAGQQKLPKAIAADIPKAIENALTIGYDDYAGQVCAFLASDYQEYYGTRSVWDGIQQQVVETLEQRQL